MKSEVCASKSVTVSPRIGRRADGVDHADGKIGRRRERLADMRRLSGGKHDGVGAGPPTSVATMYLRFTSLIALTGNGRGVAKTSACVAA